VRRQNLSKGREDQGKTDQLPIPVLTKKDYRRLNRCRSSTTFQLVSNPILEYTSIILVNLAPRICSSLKLSRMTTTLMMIQNYKLKLRLLLMVF
jgi:hypothetical protein